MMEMLSAVLKVGEIEMLVNYLRSCRRAAAIFSVLSLNKSLLQHLLSSKEVLCMADFVTW
jgi:hypothetical protein